MKYDEYTNKNKALDNQEKQVKKQLKTKIAGFKKQKLQNKIDKLKKSMNTFVAGPSNYN